MNNEKAAEYLTTSVDLDKWVVCRVHLHGRRLYGARTSNRVESGNSSLLPARHEGPLRFLDKTAELQMGWINERREESEKWVSKGVCTILHYTI